MILILSILIRVMAMVWSIVVWRGIRDWRMGFLTATLGLMALRQALTLYGGVQAEGWGRILRVGSLTELPGLVVSVLVGLAVFFLAGIIRDSRASAERLRVQEAQLFQAQKMEAVGQLAGGIAHDFNNLLTAITLNAAAAKKRLRNDERAREALADVLSASDSAARLTRDLLAFARPDAHEARVVDLNALLLDLDPMLRKTIGEHIELVTLPAASRARILVDPNRVEQLVVNMALNARDAMPGGGRLTLETRDSSSGVVLSITDSGEGMAPEVKARLFEPFFTTKPVGKGTGLGLAMCYSTVNQAGGEIDVTSDLGRGTRFEVTWPLTDAEAEAGGAAGEEVTPAGSETILLVEDEPLVLEAVRSAFEKRGYQVLVAANGEEACRVAGDTPYIDLLVTDVVMPQMGGDELVRRLRESRPDLPVIMMSGYSQTRDEDRLPKVTRLQKPFTPEQLLKTVRAVLEQETRAAPHRVA